MPAPPFFGSRVVKGIALADYAAYLDERATFLGQWGLKPSRGDGPGYDELVDDRGAAAAAMWLDRIHTEGLHGGGRGLRLLPVRQRGQRPGDPAPRWRSGRRPSGPGSSFPRQRRDRRLCLADFFRPAGVRATPTSWRCSWSPWARRSAGRTAELYAANAYRDYLELHGLSVQLTEALAEMWHAPGARGARLRRRGRSRPGRDLPAGLPRVALLLRLPGLPGPGGPAQLVGLLDPSRIGVELSEELQLHPEQSTDAIVVHHPEAKYFNAT